MAKQEPPSEKEKRSLQSLINDVYQCVLSVEPEQGDTIDDLAKSKRIQLEATRPRRLHHELKYRVLFPSRGTEIAMIIPDNVSDTAIKAGVDQLSEFKDSLKEGEPRHLPAGGYLYLEYEQLHVQFGWTWKQIEEQISYDFLVTILILKNEKPGSPIYDYTLAFQEALIIYLHFAKPEDFLQDILDNYQDRNYQTGFTGDFESTHEKIRYGRTLWKNELDKFTYVQDFRGLLLGFWLVSFLKGYWKCLDFDKRYSRWNSGKRQKLAYEYIKQIIAQLPELSETGITP